MSTASDDPTLASANPFSPIGVATLMEPDTGTVTIDTPALREARSYLDAYLKAISESPDEPAAPGAGNVIAITGDHGTGKTHLARELLRHARQSTTTNTHTVYIDHAWGSVVVLYRRFIEKLQEVDVVDRVREYYIDVVTDYLHDSELTQPMAEQLHARDVDPRVMAERLGLVEADLLQEVQHRLQQVTQNDVFAAAFTLLLRPRFQDAVWRWFAGDAPDQVLVERGITTAIATEAAALEAMGVFALLYGHRSHRLILVVDELENVLREPGVTSIGAFKKLLTVFAQAGAFLVLVGLPDSLQVIGLDARQRIGSVVSMSPLTRENVETFIRVSQQRLFGVERLEPFTPESVDYIVKLAVGNPRKIIRLCYHAYRKAVDEASSVSAVMIRQLTRTHVSEVSIDEIRRMTKISLIRNGWYHLTDHMLGSSALTRVDEWVYDGDRSDGLGIIITDFVLGKGDIEDLSQRVRAIQSATSGAPTLLIVNGYIDTDAIAQLNDVFDVRPIVYDPRYFDDELSAIVKLEMYRMKEAFGPRYGKRVRNTAMPTNSPAGVLADPISDEPSSNDLLNFTPEVAGHVFISYSRINRAYVERLASHLTAAAIPVWYDFEVETGEPFSQRIQQAIDECSAFVVILTPAAVASEWVRRELSRGIRKGKPLCPLLQEPCEIPIELDGVQQEIVTQGVMPSPRFVARLRRLLASTGTAPSEQSSST